MILLEIKQHLQIKIINFTYFLNVFKHRRSTQNREKSTLSSTSEIFVSATATLPE